MKVRIEYMNIAIIFTGGSGVRMGVPEPFLQISGKQ